MRLGWPALVLLLGCPSAQTPSTEPAGATEGSPASSATSSDPVTDPSETTTSATVGSGSSDGELSTGGDGSSSSGETPPANLSPGCGMPSSGDVLDGLIEVDGQMRDYIIELPADYEPDVPYPIIFGLHGDGSDNVQAQSSYRISEYYDGEAIVVYPNGSGAGGSPSWDTANGSDDFAFIIALAQEIGLQMCFDLDRVHAYGYSRGAAMSHALGCYRGDLFTGVGASSGWAPSTGLCQRPIAVFMSHGLTDDRIPFVTGTNARDAWAEYNGCSTETVELERDGCVAYTGCEGGAGVQWCEFDGGHQFNTVYAEAAVRLFQAL